MAKKNEYIGQELGKEEKAILCLYKEETHFSNMIRGK